MTRLQRPHGEAPETTTRREPLPAPAPTARTRRAFRVDHHVARSPPNPFAPRCNMPWVTTPPPMPVPSVTMKASDAPFAAPRRTSAHVAQVASLSTDTADRVGTAARRGSTGSRCPAGWARPPTARCDRRARVRRRPPPRCHPRWRGPRTRRRPSRRTAPVRPWASAAALRCRCAGRFHPPRSPGSSSRRHQPQRRVPSGETSSCSSTPSRSPTGRSKVLSDGRLGCAPAAASSDLAGRQ